MKSASQNKSLKPFSIKEFRARNEQSEKDIKSKKVISQKNVIKIRMKSVAIKTNIHKMLDEVSDDAFLNAILLLLKNKVNEQEKDFWDDLSKEEKASINRGLKDLKEGKIVSHEEAMKNIHKKFPFLKK